MYTVAFNTIPDERAKCNAMHRESSLVVEMRQSAVELVVIAYSTFVKGYWCEGHVDRALRVVIEINSLENFASDEVIYNSRRCGVTLFFRLLLRATESLRRHTFLIAVASSRDVAASHPFSTAVACSRDVEQCQM